MMKLTVGVTLDGSGNGTSDTSGYGNVWGDVAEIRYNGSDLVAGGTITITRIGDGGTIFAGTVAAEPWQFSPHQDMHNEAGAAITYDGTNGVNAPIPVDGQIQIEVAGGSASQSGDIYIFVR